MIAIFTITALLLFVIGLAPVWALMYLFQLAVIEER